jgi:hypothetical protein
LGVADVAFALPFVIADSWRCRGSFLFAVLSFCELWTSRVSGGSVENLGDHPGPDILFGRARLPHNKHHHRGITFESQAVVKGASG